MTLTMSDTARRPALVGAALLMAVALTQACLPGHASAAPAGHGDLTVTTNMKFSGFKLWVQCEANDGAGPNLYYAPKTMPASGSVDFWPNLYSPYRAVCRAFLPQKLTVNGRVWTCINGDASVTGSCGRWVTLVNTHQYLRTFVYN